MDCANSRPAGALVARGGRGSVCAARVAEKRRKANKPHIALPARQRTDSTFLFMMEPRPCVGTAPQAHQWHGRESTRPRRSAKNSPEIQQAPVACKFAPRSPG